MSIFAYAHNTLGEITQITTVNNGFTDLFDGKVIGNYTLFDVTDRPDVRDQRHLFYCKNGEIKQREAAPTPFYKWDLTNEVWVFNHTALFTEIRQQRDTKLLLSDWTQIPDSPLTEEQRNAWATYRQALRDVPLNNSNVTSLDEVVWPTEPTV